jgi:hypothetical protein
MDMPDHPLPSPFIVLPTLLPFAAVDVGRKVIAELKK